jgi:hypothetical protein
MASSPERPQPPTTFEYPVKIEVRPAEIELLASVPYLDLDKLARAARAEIELGYYKTDSSCGHFVRAIVEEGMVTELLVEPCSAEETEPASPELVRLFNIAREHVSSPEGEPFRPPVPVADFMANAAAAEYRGTWLVCIEICVGSFCFTCCSGSHRPDVICARIRIDENPL